MHRDITQPSKKGNSSTHYSMDGNWGHEAKGNKSALKRNTVQFCLCEVSRAAKFIETDNRMVAPALPGEMRGG